MYARLSLAQPKHVLSRGRPGGRGMGHMLRLLVAVILIVMLGVVGNPAEGVAAAEWCDTDPLVLVQTPAGNVVAIYVLISAYGAEHLLAAQAASIIGTTYTTDATAGGRATRVRLAVLVPNDLFASGFPTLAAASSGPLGSGIIYDSTSGTSGRTMALAFTLDVP